MGGAHTHTHTGISRAPGFFFPFPKADLMAMTASELTELENTVAKYVKGTLCDAACQLAYKTDPMGPFTSPLRNDLGTVSTNSPEIENVFTLLGKCAYHDQSKADPKGKWKAGGYMAFATAESSKCAYKNNAFQYVELAVKFRTYKDGATKKNDLGGKYYKGVDPNYNDGGDGSVQKTSINFMTDAQKLALMDKVHAAFKAAGPTLFSDATWGVDETNQARMIHPIM